MAILKASEGIRLNATSGTSADYGTRMWHLTKVIPTTGANLITFTQSSSPTYRGNIAITVFFAAQRTTSYTEMPARVEMATIYLNTNGNPTFDSNVFTIASGGNAICGATYSSSGTTCLVGISGASTEVYGGLIVHATTNMWNRISVTIN